MIRARLSGGTLTIDHRRDTRFGGCGMSASSLKVDPHKLAMTSGSMDTVADQLTVLKQLIHDHCHLPSLALGIVGARACATYNSACDTGEAAAGTLQADAHAMSEALGANAKGYVVAEAANLQKIEQVAETAPAPSTDRGNFLLPLLGGTFLTRIGAVMALEKRLTATGTASAAALAQLEKAKALRDELRQWAIDGSVSGDQGLGRVAGALFAQQDVTFAEKKAVALGERLSRLSELSAQTDSVLRMSSPSNITIAAVSALWSANAIVMASDDQIDGAIKAWYGVHAGAEAIFGPSMDPWMEAIRASLYPDWTGDASSAAEKRFESFTTTGQAFAVQAKKTADTLNTVVGRLNEIYNFAFDFATVQCGIIAVATVMSIFNPEALIFLRYAGFVLQTQVTLAVNAMLAAAALLIAT